MLFGEIEKCAVNRMQHIAFVSDFFFRMTSIIEHIFVQ